MTLHTRLFIREYRARNWCRWCGCDLPLGPLKWCEGSKCLREAYADAKRRLDRCEMAAIRSTLSTRLRSGRRYQGNPRRPT